MPKRVPDDMRKTEVISFRVTKKVKNVWDDFVHSYVGYKREYGSICELLEDMMDALKEDKLKIRMG